MNSLTAIEDAVITALTPLKASHGLRTLGTYAGELAPKDLGGVSVHFPAVWLVVTDVSYEDLGMMTMQVISLGLLVAHKSLRSDGQARSGAYPLLEAVRGVLMGKVLLAGLTPALVQQETIEMQTRGVCVFSAHYTVSQPFKM